jgi:hypothetical protein
MFTDVKSIFASKTFWFNLVGFCIMIADALIDVLPADWTPVLAAVGAMGNMILRYNTSSGVAILPPKR